MLPRLAILPTILILGCGASPASPASPQAPAQAAAAAPAASAPEAPPAPAPVVASEPPSARVTAVAAAKEGGMKAKIVFTNPSKRACRVTGYKLSWGAARKDIKLETFSVPPGEARERWLKVGADDGDLTALTPEGSRVEVQVECG